MPESYHETWQSCRAKCQANQQLMTDDFKIESLAKSLSLSLPEGAAPPGEDVVVQLHSSCG